MLGIAIQKTLCLVTLMKKSIKAVWSLCVLLWRSFNETATAHKIPITQRNSFDEEVIKGNEYVDSMLKDMVEVYGHEYDPYEIEDSSIGFHKKILFVNVSGEAKLHNCYILGLKTLHRSGNCQLVGEGDKLKVTADLGGGVLDFHCLGTVKFMSIGPSIKVSAILAYVELTMEMTVDAATGKNGLLTGFDIDDMKGMSVSITGLGPLNWAINPLISGITTIFQGYIRNAIENKLKNHIADRIKEYQFPVGDSKGITVDEISTTVQQD